MTLSSIAIAFCATLSGAVEPAQPVQPPRPGMPQLASAAALPVARIDAAHLVRTADALFLDWDVAPLPGCQEVVLDSLAVRKANRDTSLVGSGDLPGVLAVHWHLEDMVDTGCSNVRRGNRIDSVPSAPAAGKIERKWLVDTLVDGTSGHFLTNLPAVRNPPGPMVCPGIACLASTKDVALKYALERIRLAGVVGFAKPRVVYTLVAVSPWSRTSGLENVPEVALPQPGDALNWIDAQNRTFELDSLLRDDRPVCLSLACVLPAPVVTLPVGPVSYVYQQAADPLLKILSPRVARFWKDTLFKAGNRLELSGTVRPRCGFPSVDSTVLNEDRWLVASNGAGQDSLASAFEPRGFCANQGRRGAWPVEKDQVEIVPGTWVPLALVFPPVGARTFSAGTPLVAHSIRGGMLELDLSVAGSVRMVGVDGRIAAENAELGSGRQRLAIPRSTGILFVQVRQGETTTTFALDPSFHGR